MERRGIRGYTAVTIVMALSMALATGIIGILLNHIVAYYELDSVQSGLISSIFSVGCIVSVLLSFFMRSRMTKPALIITLGSVLAAGFLFSGFYLPFTAYLICCFSVGIGNGATDAFLDASLADMHGKNTGKVLGVRHGFFGIVGILAPVVIARALLFTDWHGIYIALGIFAGAGVTAYALIHRKYHEAVPVSRYIERPLKKEDLSIFRRPAFSLLALSIFFTMAGQNAIIVWVVRYVSTVQEHPAVASLCLSMFWLGSTVIRFVASYIPMRPEYKICIGAAGGCVSWAAGILIGTAAGMLIFCFLTGLFVGSLYPLNIGIGTKMFPEKTGMITALLSLTKYAAHVVTPLIVGALMAALPARMAILTASVMYLFNAAAAFTLSRFT